MRRIIQRQITTIQITSVEVTWDDDREQARAEFLDVTPTISEAERSASVAGGRRKVRERKPHGRRKSGVPSLANAARREVESVSEHPSTLPRPDPSGIKNDEFRGEEEEIPSELKE
ncbi:MAG: hypothetical protein HFACDABA_00332 [Anaerolineales bacterium]|nr:hypothetical protein [Anaerolineales bacterium]